MSISNLDNETAARPNEVTNLRTSAKNTLFGQDGLNFRDVIDLINPLHHIPIVGRIYRAITGDQIAPGIRIAGGTIFGGPVGAAFAAAGMAMDKTGDFVSEKLAVNSVARGKKLENSPYSIDRLVAERKMPLDVYKNLSSPRLVFDSNLPPRDREIQLARETQLASNVEWPYSTRRRHMPFIKISQLIEDNYRFLARESKANQSEILRGSKFDRRL
ncbi:MAG: hypothetical protein VX986_07935 [Pseudomonadota bacterium]|nr:hypothetical protein [Pseudomonadota bacterium]